MKLHDFLGKNGTRKLHNEGSRMDLEDKSYLHILGPDSDIGREVTAEKYRLNAGDEDFDLKVKQLFARLVQDWSFDEPIAIDLVVELFTEYPFVYDRVVTFYMNRSNFIES